MPSTGSRSVGGCQTTNLLPRRCPLWSEDASTGSRPPSRRIYCPEDASSSSRQESRCTLYVYCQQICNKMGLLAVDGFAYGRTRASPPPSGLPFRVQGPGPRIIPTCPTSPTHTKSTLLLTSIHPQGPDSGLPPSLAGRQQAQQHPISQPPRGHLAAVAMEDRVPPRVDAVDFEIQKEGLGGVRVPLAAVHLRYTVKVFQGHGRWSLKCECMEVSRPVPVLLRP